MCLSVWSFNENPVYKLILLNNRDEFLERPTAPAHFWSDEQTTILAGKDVAKGGTWLGISTNGRVAWLSNYREAPPTHHAESRGELVANFLRCSLSPADYLKTVARDAHKYHGFNLVVCDLIASQMAYFSNRLSEKLGQADAAAVNNICSAPVPHFLPQTRGWKLGGWQDQQVPVAVPLVEKAESVGSAEKVESSDGVCQRLAGDPAGVQTAAATVDIASPSGAGELPTEPTLPSRAVPARMEFPPLEFHAEEQPVPVTADCASQPPPPVVTVSPGEHVMSNALLDTPWFKSERAKALFHCATSSGSSPSNLSPDALIDTVLRDRSKPEREEDVPRTSMGPEWDTQLSSIFVDWPSAPQGPYGTRSHTALLVSHDGNVEFVERSMDDGRTWQSRRFSFKLRMDAGASNCARA